MTSLKYQIVIIMLLCSVMARSQQSKADTAVVRSYGGIQVFYNCKPLHPYWVLGKMAGKATVSHASAAFARYASEAQWNYPNCTGIIIDDIHFDNDHYEVIRTLQVAGYQDTAVFAGDIFMSATPVRPYEVVNTMRLRPDWGSLQTNLTKLFAKAGELMIAYDGIMVDDIDFGFGKSDIRVIRWTGSDGH